MTMLSHLYHLHALSALHAGAGQSTGVIDLPIARERASALPYVPGSGLKGVLREHQREHPDQRADLWKAAYGPEHDSSAGFQGALAIGDALLLCLPVRSLAGGFAWATCPLQLLRYQRDAQALELEPKPPAIVPTVADNKVLLGSANSSLTFANGQSEQVALEEFLITPDADQKNVSLSQQWAVFIANLVFRDSKWQVDSAWQTLFTQRFAILSDADFDFLAETATEVRARIRIENGTAANKALWYEENLPAETILWGVLAAHASRDGKVLPPDTMLQQVPGPDARIQLGGKATVGRGLARFVWPKPAANTGGGKK